MSLASTYSREHGRPAGMACATPLSQRAGRAARVAVATGLLALACALSTLGVSVAAASAAPGLVWGSVSEVGPPASAPSGERMLLTKVSCPAAGDCVAIGTLEPKHELQALVVEETNGVWGKAAFVEVPNASEITHSQLMSIDCPAVGDCTAVGLDENKVGLSQAIVVSETGGSWGAAQVVPQPTTSAYAVLASVACTGPGSCVAVGESRNASTKEYEAVAVTETDGSWGTSVAVPQPADAKPNGGLLSVSCPTANECAATGWYQSKTTANYDVMGANEVDGTWTSEGIAISGDTSGPPLGPQYTGMYVSCPASGSCTASGYYRETALGTYRAIGASYAGGKWSSSAQLINAPSGNEYAYLYAPSCPASGSCSAVGDSYTPVGENSELLVASSTGGVWGNTETLPMPSNFLTEAEAKTLELERYGELLSVSCWAVGACEAVGEYTTQSGEYAPMVASETGGVWSGAEGIAPPSNAKTGTEEGEAWLSDVSCTAGGVCGGVGSFKSNAGELRGMTASAGSALSVTSLSLPAGQVGAPYSAQLAATGGLGPYTWSVASGALPAGLSLNAATGVISGKPTGAGASFTVSVANAGPPAQTAGRALSIAINPAPITPKPAIAIVSSKLKASAKHQVQVTLACREAACKGIVEIVAVTKVRVRRKHKTVTEKRTVVLASGAYKIAAGKTETFEIKLTATGRTLLAKLAKHHSLSVKLAVTVQGGATKSKTVKLS